MAPASETSPRLRIWAGIGLFLVGGLLAIIGLRADELGIGGSTGRSAKQTVATALGVAGILSGAAITMHGLGRRALRADRLVPLVVALGVYGGTYAVAWEHIPPSGDEPHYMLEAYSLALDRDRNLAADYVDPVRIAPMFGAFAATRHAFNYRGDPRVAISIHGVGTAALLAPVAALTDDQRWLRVVMIVLAAMTAYLVLSLMRRLSGDRGPLVYMAWGLVVFSVPVLGYSNQVYPELPAALLALAAIRLLVERPSAVTLGSAGVLAALLPWFHVRFGLITVALLVAIVARVLADAPPVARDRARRLLGALVPSLVVLILLAVAQEHWYGSPSPNAAARFQSPPPSFDLPWAYSYSVGGLLNPRYGWLPFAPVHLLAVAGLVPLMRRHGAWALGGIVVVVLHLALVGSAKPVENGYAFPARYQVTVIPIAAVALLFAVRERMSLRLIAVPLAVVTVAFSVVAVVRTDRLVTTGKGNTPRLPLARELGPVWPHTAPRRRGGDYPDWPHALLFSAGLLGLLVLGGRLRSGAADRAVM